MPDPTNWDAFDRLFDEAFSRRKARSPGHAVFSPTPFTPYPQQIDSSFCSPQYAPDFVNASPAPFAGATPYAIHSSAAFSYSNDSLGDGTIAGGEDEYHPFWLGGNGAHKSTVTSKKIVRRPIGLPLPASSSSESASNSTSNDAGSLGLSASTPSPPPQHPSSVPREGAKSPTPKIKRRKSKVTFQDSADGKTVTAKFDLQGIQKSNVHVSYQNDKVVISWESVTTDERTEGERVTRERKERKYVRTLPLPEGTQFEEVKASMDGRYLTLTYPKFVARRVNAI